MSFVSQALGGLGFDKVKDAAESVVGGITGKTAADASKRAAQTQAQAQMEALNYLREQEEIPQQFREGALGQLGGLYGLEGGTAGADRMIRQNPIFQATQGMIPQQEEAILRNQSATGALRSGGTDQMLAENQRMNTLQAYQNTMGGLQGLAGLQSYAPQIAQGMAGIGQTLGQGEIGGAMARQEALGGLLQAGGKIGAAAFSDTRLKDNIQPMGDRYGHAWYSWTWNEEAEALGLSGNDYGVLAQEVATTNPDAIGVSMGYLTVDYSKLESA